MSELQQPRSTIEHFLQLADTGKWEEFDEEVLKVCNDQQFIEWSTEEGLKDPRENARVLAISIFEQTNQETLEPEQETSLRQSFLNDESLHLRRKAAFVLFKHGARDNEVIIRIKEARDNDPELTETATKILDKMK